MYKMELTEAVKLEKLLKENIGKELDFSFLFYLKDHFLSDTYFLIDLVEGNENKKYDLKEGECLYIVKYVYGKFIVLRLLIAYSGGDKIKDTLVYRLIDYSLDVITD